MAEEIPTQPKADTQAAAVSGNENQSVSLNLSHAVNFCAAGLLVCFFLPWIDFFLGKPSGLDLAKEGGKLQILWGIPIFCVLTIFAGLTKRSQKTVAQMTGALPFIVLGVGINDQGKDLMHVLGIGAYAGLTLGLLMFILPRRLK
jgi:hypothetical protein